MLKLDITNALLVFFNLLSMPYVSDADDVDDHIRLNQIQVIGTHNSYHVQTRPERLRKLSEIHPDAMTWAYTHAPLNVQLDRGIRSLELDMYAHPDGTKVMHIPIADPGTTCPRLTDALTLIAAWSRQHPGHVPIIVFMETKIDRVPPAKTYPFNKAALSQIDREVRSTFESSQLITPDMVRDGLTTLAEAIRLKGWPTLKNCRGKVMLVLFGPAHVTSLYLKDHPSLDGRPLFVAGHAGEPCASVFSLDSPTNPMVKKLLRDGCIVRTRSDANLLIDESNPTARRDAAFACGAQIISTDFPSGEADPKTGFEVTFPKGTVSRSNPVTASSN
jgi:hypothetical protein